MSPKKKQSVDDNNDHLQAVKEVLENTQANIKQALELLKQKNIDHAALIESLKGARAASRGLSQSTNGTERIIEGVFNGEKMVGPDGVEYIVPANYASKSKLVEGDILKLTITPDGSFIYKQIGPAQRKQLVADLALTDSGADWFAIKGKQRWKLLTASVTYFHGEPGDEVVILVPEDGSSNWAAVENIIKKS